MTHYMYGLEKKEEGIKEGIKEGEEKMSFLMSILLEKKEFEKASRCAKDSAYREEMYKEYHIS